MDNDEKCRKMIDDIQGVIAKASDRRYVSYEHHGRRVSVRSDLKGRHREHCLCHVCFEFRPGKEDNCPYAQMLFAFLCLPGGPTVSPVWECEAFKADADKLKETKKCTE